MSDAATHADEVTVITDDAIHGFEVNVPQEDLEDLRRRIAATRWPERETVEDRTQGVQLATMEALARHWATDYDWRSVEARLQACRSSSPRSTEWTSISSMFAPSTRVPCR